MGIFSSNCKHFDRKAFYIIAYSLCLQKFAHLFAVILDVGVVASLSGGVIHFVVVARQEIQILRISWIFAVAHRDHQSKYGCVRAGRHLFEPEQAFFLDEQYASGRYHR